MSDVPQVGEYWRFTTVVEGTVTEAASDWVRVDDERSFFFKGPACRWVCSAEKLADVPNPAPPQPPVGTVFLDKLGRVWQRSNSLEYHQVGVSTHVGWAAVFKPITVLTSAALPTADELLFGTDGPVTLVEVPEAAEVKVLIAEPPIGSLVLFEKANAGHMCRRGEDGLWRMEAGERGLDWGLVQDRYGVPTRILNDGGLT